MRVGKLRPRENRRQTRFAGYFVQKDPEVLLSDAGPVGTFPFVICEFFHEVGGRTGHSAFDGSLLRRDAT